jgi:apolipoprotein N-acyltransferase
MPLSLRVLLAAAAGALLPLSFSPFHVWLLQPIALGCLYLLLLETGPKPAAWTGWGFGLGMFGVGTSWVYVSIHDFGNAGTFLSFVITLGFVAAMALFTALQTWVYRRFCKTPLLIAGFAACWVLGEWFRGWFLTGFPWLYLGYAHVESLFAGLAPLTGVLGISLWMALSGALLGAMTLHYCRNSSPYALAGTQLPTLLLFLWGFASLSNKLQWIEQRTDDDVTVGIVQGNIEQGLKFRADFLQESLDVHERLSRSLWQNEIVIWPETAIPMRYQNAGDVLQFFGQQATATGSTLISGIFFENEAGDIHNSIVAIGNGSGIWHKQKLVPFGEYVPLRRLIGTILEIFSLPMSSLQPGPAGQQSLMAGKYRVAPFICYEIVYPDFVRRYGRDADLLLTVSNDTWFGASWGPLQHLQMAQMRSLELGRSMARGTNNGVSALIDGHGHILSRSPQFESAVLQGSLPLYTGHTPYSRLGSFPVLLLCGLILMANSFPKAKRCKASDSPDARIKDQT